MTDITDDVIEDINVAALEAYGAPLAEHDDPYFNDFLLAFVRIRAERLESARKQGCPDKLDEIESNLQYLFGRAAKEGHESAMRLAGEVAKKIQQYRLEERQRERQAVAVPDETISQLIDGLEWALSTIDAEDWETDPEMRAACGKYAWCHAILRVAKSAPPSDTVKPNCVGFYNKRTGELKAVVTSDDGSLDDWVDVYPAPDCPHPIVEELTKE
jgi:hypothetical protein